MRCFVAIGLPEPARAALERVRDELAAGRPVAGDDMHITLTFLDRLSPEQAATVHEALGEIRAPAAGLRIRGVDTFGGRRPRVVFAGVEPAPELVRLRKKVRQALRGTGTELRRERFRPHVTLARFSRTAPRQDLARLGRFLQAHGDLSLPPVQADEFGLYRSHLGPQGASYELLAGYPLG